MSTDPVEIFITTTTATVDFENWLEALRPTDSAFHHPWDGKIRISFCAE